jgi:hypothetical protein
MWVILKKNIRMLSFYILILRWRHIKPPLVKKHASAWERIHCNVAALGVIIFNSVRFLSKKITKPDILKKPEPVQTDRFGFTYFRTKISSNRFGLVFPVWLGFSSLARAFFWFFCLDSIQFGFFSFRLIKLKLNQTG